MRLELAPIESARSSAPQVKAAAEFRVMDAYRALQPKAVAVVDALLGRRVRHHGAHLVAAGGGQVQGVNEVLDPPGIAGIAGARLGHGMGVNGHPHRERPSASRHASVVP